MNNLKELKKITKELKETNKKIEIIVWMILFGICIISAFLVECSILSFLFSMIAMYIAFTKFKENKK